VNLERFCRALDALVKSVRGTVKRIIVKLPHSKAIMRKIRDDTALIKPFPGRRFPIRKNYGLKRPKKPQLSGGALKQPFPIPAWFRSDMFWLMSYEQSYFI